MGMEIIRKLYGETVLALRNKDLLKINSIHRGEKVITLAFTYRVLCHRETLILVK